VNEARISPYVLGDELVGAVRKVKVDEVGEQSHGDNNGDDVFSLSLSTQEASPCLLNEMQKRLAV
jgi:D-arabinose 1-dehydrogenase-like Zn-dependent alcohol dehydrogenase